MLIPINDQLKHSILDNLPKQYSNLEKAVWIYRQLCLKTDYSLEYYLNAHSPEVLKKYTNPQNIVAVDGEANKNVVCYTFCAIYSMLLIEAGIIDENQWDAQNMLSDNGTFGTMHAALSFIIDGQRYSIDSSDQILGGSDLTLSKYSILPLTGWETDERSANFEQAENSLKKAIEKVQADDTSLTSLAEEYIEIKGKEYLNLPIEKRVKLFLSLAKNVPTKYSISSFNFLLKLKHLLFTDAELLSSVSQIDKHIDIQFVKDEENNEFKAILFFNPAGYTGDMGYENLDSLNTYIISFKHGTIEEFSLEQIQKAFDSAQFTIRQGDTFRQVKHGKYMFKKAGIAKVEGNYSKPTDPKQQWTLIDYVRTHILTGVKERLTIEQYNSLMEGVK